MIELTKNINELQTYLQELSWVNQDEVLEKVEKPGEGNMNLTLRLKTNQRSFILKQSRGYVEKYPQVKAPEDRALNEAAFYELIASIPKLKSSMPEILAVDRKNYVLLMEDLGEGSDYTFLYQKGSKLSRKELQQLLDFISTLHLKVKADTSPNRIRNLKMRKLNHQHIFELPFMIDNGFDLDAVLPGLQAASLAAKNDNQLIKVVGELDKIYLADGDTLLHGDFFPGSWLKTKKGIKVIDPEFCFFGASEFEVGVTLAHLKMSEQSAAIQELFLTEYNDKNPIDRVLIQKFGAVEVIRRIIGLAQLPLSLNLEERIQLLEEAINTLKFS